MKSVTSNDTSFNNSFSLGNQEVPRKNSKCTYTDKYGNTVSIGDIENDYFL